MYLSYGWYDLVIVTRQSQRLATSATTKRYWNTMYAYVRRNYAKLNNRLMTKRHIVLKQCGENSHPLILVLKRLTGIYSKMYHSPRVINSVRNREVGYFCCQSPSYQIAYAVNNEGGMGPTYGPYILQLCMCPSYFWGVWPTPYFAHWSPWSSRFSFALYAGA